MTEKTGSSGYERLDSQLRWYSSKGSAHKRWFLSLKVLEVVFAAAIPVLSAIAASRSDAGWPVVLAGALGLLIVTLEGLQAAFGFHHNWLSYRTTTEALKQEKYLFLAGAGPYAGLSREESLRRVAERTEALISDQHGRWISNQNRPFKEDRASPTG